MADELTASGRPKVSLSIPRVELPEIIGPLTEEQPLTCDLCGKELLLGTPDDGTVAIGPQGGTWNVCESCRAAIVVQFPAPHSYEPPVEIEYEYDENGDMIFDENGKPKIAAPGSDQEDIDSSDA